MIAPPKVTKAPDIERKAIKDWGTGTVTDYDARRLVDNSLVTTTNMVLEQNGVIRPRPSLALYGPQPVGEVLGEIFECKVIGENLTPTFYMIAMMVVDGVAHVYKTTGESSEWEQIGTKTYDTTAAVHFLQIRGKILVLNGADALSYIDTADWSISSFSAIPDPDRAPTLAEAHGLSGTDFKIYYAITANSTVGETAASPVLAQSVSTPRDMWDSTSQYVKINWTAVPGATSYNVYMGVSADGAGQPELYLIAANLDAATLTYTDNGLAAKDLGRGSAPIYNTTAGPRAKRGSIVNGRVWLVGDTDNPYYVRRGGDYDHELDFSPANGGGFVAIASGTKEIPIAVMPFRKGQGDNTVVVLTQGSNGSGKRYHLVYATVTYGAEQIVTWQVTEDSGADGTDSPDGVVIHNNTLYYPSRDGFKTTGTIPQLQNVLSTTQISNTVRDQVELLNTRSMNKAVGLVYDGKIYWALPFQSEKNNRVWVLDLEHEGAWLLSWYINADWMWLYNDNSGETHFLILSDNKICELTRTFATKDRDSAFQTELESGQIGFSKDGREWARLIQVVFTLLKPIGEINFEVRGYTEDGEQVWKKSIGVAAGGSATGWSEVERSWSSARRWSGLKKKYAKGSGANAETQDIIIEVDEDVRYFQYRVSSTTSEVDYALSSVVAEYVDIGIKDLNS